MASYPDPTTVVRYQPAALAQTDQAAEQFKTYAIAIDSKAGFAYTITGNGASTNQGQLTRWQMNNSTVSATRAFAVQDVNVEMATINIGTKSAFVVTKANPTTIVTYDIGTMTRVREQALNEDVDISQCTTVPSGALMIVTKDSNNNPLINQYTRTKTGQVLIATLTMEGEAPITGLQTDPAGFIQVTTAASPAAKVIKIPPFSSSGIQPTSQTSITLDAGDGVPQSGQIDPVGGYLYLGTSNGNLVKIDIRVIRIRVNNVITTQTKFERVDVMKLDAGSASIGTILPYTKWGSIYCTTKTPTALANSTLSSIIYEVRLSDFTRVGLNYFPAGVAEIGAVDAPFGHAYQGMAKIDADGEYTSEGAFQKVRLAQWAFSPLRNITIGEDSINPKVLLFDSKNTFAQMVDNASPRNLSQFRLSTRTEVASIPIDTGLANFACAVRDGKGFGQFITDAAGGTIYKIRLADCTSIASITLPNTDQPVTKAVVDTKGNHMYLLTNDGAGATALLRINLNTFTRIDRYDAREEDGEIRDIFVDENSSLYYTRSEDGAIVRVNLTM